MKKTFSFMLVCVMILGVVLSSCSSNDTPKESGSQSETKEPTTTTYGYVLIENGTTNFQLVRSDASEHHNPEIASVREFYSQIKEKTGVDLSIKTDWDPEDVAEYEIIVGKTTRETDVPGIDRSQLKERDFLITLQDNRLFLIGGSAEGTVYAVKYFIENYVNADGCVSVPKDIHLLVEYEYPVGVVTLDGKAIEEYRIVYAASGGAMVKHAAEELRDYLYQATGKMLALVNDVAEVAHSDKEILIGKTNREQETTLIDREGLGEEGFVIAVKDGKLVISGGEGELRGTLYGVYEFLEAYLGCRFFTTDTEVILPSETVALENGLNDRQVPQFAFRDSFWKCYFDADISAKRRLNFNERRSFTEAHGGGFTYAGFVHTISQLAEVGNGLSAQPCLSDETIYQTVLKNAKAWLRANPHAKILSISQNDTQKNCHCTECAAKDEAAGTPMGSLLLFVNRIARGIADEYPDVLVDTLSYQYTRKPPIGIVSEDNVVIRYCPFECCRNHALNDPNCPDNAVFVSEFEGWCELTNQVYIWDYDTNFGCPQGLFPSLDILRENIRYFADGGVSGYFMQGLAESSSGEFGELRAYLVSKLLWDPYMSEEEYHRHMEEFLTYYYGNGWEQIGTWLKLLQDQTNVDGLHFGLSIDPYQQKLMQMLIDREEEFDALWDTAEAMAGDEITLMHVKKSRIQYDYLQLCRRYLTDYLRGNTEREAYLEEARSFLSWCIKCGIRYHADQDLTKVPTSWTIPGE